MSVQILGADGRPLPPAAPKMKYGALSGSGRVPYDAADSFSDQMANWQPALWSPDNEINIYREYVNYIFYRVRGVLMLLLIN
ncbi:hypothetical protein [Morganella morganii]|uniref:hypothetical protein n=1 Tax=Morganella morganii TaxID=582 RepID=UPI003EBC3FAA